MKPVKEKIRLLLVDNHPVVREGLKMLFSDEVDIAVIGEAADGVTAFQLAARLQPDVVLMDVMLAKLDGIAVTEHLRHYCPNSQVIILTGSLEQDLRVREALQAGAVGYLLKDVRKEELLGAIRGAVQGKVTLHPEALADLASSMLTSQETLGTLTKVSVSSLSNGRGLEGTILLS
jgi:DNA-binding NarL/FixJ family response regulator